MNNVKSWKKNFKKTGALALATLVMCGSASFARAKDTITLNQLGSDSTVEQKYNDETGQYETTGNVKTVLGYQTDASSGYAANITWGDMIFVYDNGKYDPETGRLIATDTLSDVQPDALRTTVTTETPEYGDHGGWLYENASTQEVYELKMIYKKLNEDNEVTEEIYDSWTDEGTLYDTEDTLTVDEETYAIHNVTTMNESGEETILYKVVEVSEVYVNVENPSDTLSELGDLQVLYTKEKVATDAGYWYNFNGTNNSVQVQNLSTSGLKFTATPEVITENAGENVSFSLYSRAETDGLTYNENYQPTHGGEEESWYAGTSLTGTLDAPKLDPITGEINIAGGACTFYLNISGKPSGNVILQSAKDEVTDATVLGTITLNFSTSGDTKLPIKGNPTTGQPSEGEETGGE